MEALKSKRNAGWIVIFLALVVFLLLGLKAANASPRCVASDGGINYYTKGTVSGSVDGKPVTFTDYCKGDFLVEFYCQYNTIRNVTKFCQTGCSDGECNKCIPGEQRCRDNFVERCNVFGTGWSRVQSCRYGCSEGMCTGERQVGSAVQTEFAIRLIAHLLRELFPTCYDSDG
ncbi:MAG TPA: hypothetical protein ENN46_00240, partial [Candidatus Woesearchaeota archaeon]|nr:hypothetical protein [Candidatus Woesearchaeota archaeon]